MLATVVGSGKDLGFAVKDQVNLQN